MVYHPILTPKPPQSPADRVQPGPGANDPRSFLRRLNGMAMYDILPELAALPPQTLKALVNNRSYYAAGINMARLEFAMFVVMERKLPTPPADLPPDQVEDARRFLFLRREDLTPMHVPHRDHVEAPVVDEQTELAKDIFQFFLDIVGIVDPTGVADGMNGMISLGRGDYAGAIISLIGLIPYIGDAAKLGKLPKYAKSVRKAVNLALKDEKFAKKLRPALVELQKAIKKLPLDQLPPSARKELDEIIKIIDNYMGRFGASVAKGVVLKPISFVGSIGRRPFKQLTQQEMRNAFAKVGLREAHNGHVFMRLIQRGPAAGINNLDDFARAWNNATKKAGRPGTVEVHLPSGVMVIVNGAMELITITF